MEENDIRSTENALENTSQKSCNDGYRQLLVDVLLRKARGYDSAETTEEFAAVDGEMTLVKRKVVTKSVPPDLSAIKVLMEIDDKQQDVTRMTDEELREEKLRLIGWLNEMEQ